MKSRFFSFAVLALSLALTVGCAQNTVQTQSEKMQGNSVSSVSAASSAEKPFTLPYVICSTTAGNGLSVSLEMVEGALLTSSDPGYVPGGGMDGLQFDHNYIGKYQLVVYDGDQVTDAMPVAFGSDEQQNYTDDAPFSFQFYDYNGDGDIEFTLGCGGWVGDNRIYNLYSLSSDGTLSLLLDQFEQQAQDFSVLLPAIEGGFVVSFYDAGNGGNTVETRYVWDGERYSPEVPQQDQDMISDASSIA